MAEDPWLYCSHCERAFQSKDKNSCQYDSCDGELGDVWGWDVVLELNHSYPEIPVHGREYPLFGAGKYINFGKSGRRLQHGDRKKTGLEPGRTQEAPPMNPPNLPTGDRTGATLLYVGDDNLTQGLVIQILQRQFPQITLLLAQNGQDGLDLYAKNRPEIVVTDVRMPIVDGIAMVRKIKEQDSDAQIIILSASDETDRILEAIDIGINHYVLKPIQVEKLIGAIAQCLDKIDILEQLRHKDEYIRRMAYYDSLTGLPNRHLFSEFFRKSLAHAQRNKLLLALFFIDLDGFKKINDSLGHSVGDLLLKAVADRLKVCCCRHQDTVARWGGDEFIILLCDLSDKSEAVSVARIINEAFTHPMTLLNHELTVGVSIGISTFPDDGFEEDTLLRKSDSAMYCAKAQGTNRFHHPA